MLRDVLSRRVVSAFSQRLLVMVSLMMTVRITTTLVTLAPLGYSRRAAATCGSDGSGGESDDVGSLCE